VRVTCHARRKAFRADDKLFLFILIFSDIIYSWKMVVLATG
jgi:hypothetical protein